MDARSRYRPEQADLLACHALLRRHARSFHLASRLLPARVSEPAAALYAFCRLADDAVDEPQASSASRDARPEIDRLRERLARVYEDRPEDHPVDRALRTVVVAHAIPRALPEFLLEGLAWDAEGRRYETYGELQAYAARVAGSVGAMMTLLMGARSREALARACDLGVAMQLTNIARDVGEDAARGRLYLPAAWVREAGVDPDRWLAAPAPDPRMEQVVVRLLDEAASLYARAAAGMRTLPWDCRPGINAARLLYEAIGDEVRSLGHRALGQRACVPRARRSALLLMSTLAWFPAPGTAARRLCAPPLDSTRGLVMAAATTTESAAPPTLAGVVDLFIRLERNDAGMPPAIAREVRQ